MGDVFASKNPMPGPVGRCMAVWKKYDMYSPTHSSHRIFFAMILLSQTSFHIGLMEEILHHLIGSLSHCLQGFIHFRW